MNPIHLIYCLLLLIALPQHLSAASKECQQGSTTVKTSMPCDQYFKLFPPEKTSPLRLYELAKFSDAVAADIEYMGRIKEERRAEINPRTGFPYYHLFIGGIKKETPYAFCYQRRGKVEQIKACIKSQIKAYDAIYRIELQWQNRAWPYIIAFGSCKNQSQKGALFDARSALACLKDEEKAILYYESLYSTYGKNRIEEIIIAALKEPVSFAAIRPIVQARVSMLHHLLSTE